MSALMIIMSRGNAIGQQIDSTGNLKNEQHVF